MYRSDKFRILCIGQINVVDEQTSDWTSNGWLHLRRSDKWQLHKKVDYASFRHCGIWSKVQSPIDAVEL